MLTFEFTGVEGRMTQSEILTSGMVGKEVQILFDESWTGLSRTLVFRSGDICRTADGTESVAVIPEDVLARPFRKLYVGLYGTDEAGTVVIPTIMAEGPMIRYGADPTEDPEGEDLPVWKNLQEQIGDLTLLKTDDRTCLVAAINENSENLADLSEDLSSQRAQLGQLSDLETEAKDSLVAAVNELHAELQQPRSAGTGLSEAAAALLVEILRHAIYDGDQTGNIDALAAELGLSAGDSGGDVTPEEPEDPDEPVVTLTGITASYTGGDVPVGTDLTDLTGITVTAHYSDGSSQAVTDFTLSGTIAEGSNTVTVTYAGKTAAFTVNGIAEEEPEVTLTGITASYTGGDVPVGTALMDLTDVTVTAHYSDGASRTVTDYTLSGTIAEGSNTVTVTYEGFTAAFTVTGIAEEESEVTLTGITASYAGGDVPVGTDLTDLTGITVTANYSDGSYQTVTDFTLSGTIAEGSNTVTVTYEGFTAAFTVTGIAEEEPKVVMTGISVSYAGGDVPVGTALTDLTDVTVTAHYSNGMNMMAEEFDLSGQIAEGENTITVTYEGHTATFTVVGVVAAPVVDQTETLELVYASGYPNVTTFAWTEQSSAGTYVIAKRGNLGGGVLSVDFDPTKINWNLNLYVYDADGKPYCKNEKAFSNTSHPTYGWETMWGGDMDNDYLENWDFDWTDVGAGVGFGIVLAPFTIQLPAGCTCIACIRAGSSGIGDFATWAKNGGITFTVTTYK